MKKKILLAKDQDIFGKENAQTLKDLGYDKMDSFEQAQFREMIIRDALTSAFNKEDTA